jgi:hypothetical protein
LKTCATEGYVETVSQPATVTPSRINHAQNDVRSSH